MEAESQGSAIGTGLQIGELQTVGSYSSFLHGGRVVSGGTGPPRSLWPTGFPVVGDGSGQEGRRDRGGRTLQVTFFGVRGSCPCSGAGYLRYGGNTSCVAVTVGDEPPIVLDLGTGLRPLGRELESRFGTDAPIEMTALLT